MNAAMPTLLYIDDDPALARLVERGLKRQGFAVVHAPSGETGLARLEQGGIDVVALDQYMPGSTASRRWNGSRRCRTRRRWCSSLPRKTARSR